MTAVADKPMDRGWKLKLLLERRSIALLSHVVYLELECRFGRGREHRDARAGLLETCAAERARAERARAYSPPAALIGSFVRNATPPPSCSNSLPSTRQRTAPS